MNTIPDPLDAVAIPALLRHARSTYANAMRAALEDAGYDDIPRNGLYVIGALAIGETPLAQVIRELGVTKQAAGQLVDSLAAGYLTRQLSTRDDRRRLTVTLTERGRAAAETQAAARDLIDGELAARIGADEGRHAREALAALIEIGRASPHED